DRSRKVERSGGAAAREIDTDVDADAEADARQREPELPRMPGAEPPRRQTQEANHAPPSSMRASRIDSTRSATLAASRLCVAMISVVCRRRQGALERARAS